MFCSPELAGVAKRGSSGPTLMGWTHPSWVDLALTSNRKPIWFDAPETVISRVTCFLSQSLSHCHVCVCGKGTLCGQLAVRWLEPVQLWGGWLQSCLHRQGDSALGCVWAIPGIDKGHLGPSVRSGSAPLTPTLGRCRSPPGPKAACLCSAGAQAMPP